MFNFNNNEEVWIVYGAIVLAIYGAVSLVLDIIDWIK